MLCEERYFNQVDWEFIYYNIFLKIITWALHSGPGWWFQSEYH